jgi:hypothetical protein
VYAGIRIVRGSARHDSVVGTASSSHVAETMEGAEMASLFWNICQHHRISTVESDSSAAYHRSQDAIARIQELEHTVEKQMLLSHALWEILRERDGLADETLAAKVREIDLRDGAEDGRMSATELRRCQKCGHDFNSKRPRCVYCGEPVIPLTAPPR